jgi:hypothetical protein
MWSGLLVVAIMLAAPVLADPDPPVVDGGTTTFIGNWTVDPGDDLVYINQTIILDGILTIEANGALTLLNSTLVLNSTFVLEFGFEVLGLGTLNVTSGSILKDGSAGMAWFGTIEAEAHLLIEDSTVQGVGSEDSSGPRTYGLFSSANDTTVRRALFKDNSHHMILESTDGASIVDSVIEGGLLGVWIRPNCTATTLDNLTIVSASMAIRVDNCTDLVVANSTLQGGFSGFEVLNSSVTILNGAFRDMVGPVASYYDGGRLSWRTDAMASLINSSLILNGSIEVRAGGRVDITNSTLIMMNELIQGGNGISVMAGGSMRVTSGSDVSRRTGNFRFWWKVWPNGELVLTNSTVTGAGWNSTNPGLEVMSSGNTILDTSFKDCYYGLSVLGDANTLASLDFEDCYIALRWSGTDGHVSDITAINCSEGGILLDGAINFTLTRANLSLPGASAAIRVISSENTTLSDLLISGPPEIGLSSLSSSGLLIINITGTANQTVVFIHGAGVASGATLIGGTLEGGVVGLRLSGITDILLINLTARNATTDLLQAVDVHNMTVISSTLEGGLIGGYRTVSGIHVTGGDDLVIDVVQVNGTTNLVWLERVDGFQVMTSVLTWSSNGLRFQGCTNGTIIDSTIFQGDNGAFLDSTLDTTFVRCSIGEFVDGIELTNGTAGCVFQNLTVSSSTRAFRLSGPTTSGNSIVDLILINCTEGLNMSGTGTGNKLVSSLFEGVPRVVVATGSSGLEVEDCSFRNCTWAVLAQVPAAVNWTLAGTAECVNSSISTQGWITVLSGGSLTINGSRLTLKGGQLGLSGILGEDGSTIRLINGTEVTTSTRSETLRITSYGLFVARDSRILGGQWGVVRPSLLLAGDQAVLLNVTFEFSHLALTIQGSDPILRNCTFVDNVQSILLDGTMRPLIDGCTFIAGEASWSIRGTFNGSLQIKESSFDGLGTTSMCIFLEEGSGQAVPFTLLNSTIANYTRWGLEDLHNGSIIMDGTTLVSANATIGPQGTSSVIVTDLVVIDSDLWCGPGRLTAQYCTFINSSLKVHDNTQGSRVMDSTFKGSLGTDIPCISIESSLSISLRDLTVSEADVGLRVSAGSEIVAERCSFDGVRMAALEVTGSIARFEDCHVGSLLGSGVRSWAVGSRVEMRNSSISALPGRTGHDVDASGGGDIYLLNTTFNRTSTSSTGSGRIEVLWYVTVEPRLPWGGVLWGPENLIILDATSAEVVNTTFADVVMRLYEFVEVDEDRTPRTPHNIMVTDARVGVSYDGAHTINGSIHIILELVDVIAPSARAGPDQVVDENLIVTLDGSGTSDNDPTFLTTGTYRWEFDDYGTNIMLTGQVVRHVFSVPGKFVINLTVIDRAGNEATDSVIIQVLDTTSPVIRFSGNITLNEDTWYIFDASATTDNDPGFNITSGTFTWEIDLLDGTLEREGASLAYAFPDPGNFSGTLSVLDVAGNGAERTFWVLVLDVTPPLIEGVSSSTVFEVREGLLDASACSDNVAIISIEWSVTFNGNVTLLSGATPIFQFNELGMYSIHLELGDEAGNMNSTTVFVVYDDVPTISMPEWVVAMAGEQLMVGIQVHDIYSTELTLGVASGPGGALVEGSAEAAFLVWTPGPEHAGSEVAIEVEVYDGFKSSSSILTIHVNAGRGASNRAPLILSNPPLGAKRATPYIYSVEALDPDGDEIGFLLVTAPDGMSVSRGGTISWDPPFDFGIELVDITLVVTDGRDGTLQSWTIRWRDPPNRAPIITFTLPPMEVKVGDEFWVDLLPYLPDPDGYTVDEDDPNAVILWDLELDETMAALISRNGLVFRLQALEVPGETVINLTASDPSGAKDTLHLDLTITKRPQGDGDGDGLWFLPWLVGLIIIALAIMIGTATTRRSRHVEEGMEVEEGEWEMGRPSGESPKGTDMPPVALGLESVEEVLPEGFEPFEETTDELTSEVKELLEEVDGFVELEGRTDLESDEKVSPKALDLPGGTRVVDDIGGTERRPFHLEGVAVLDHDGKPLASTGRIEEVLGPYQDSLDRIRSSLGSEGTALVEIEGRRALLMVRDDMGILSLLRGREDDDFREGVSERLDLLIQDSSDEAALATVDDVLALSGRAATAEVVKDAWTARLDAKAVYTGSLLCVRIRLRNDTDHILNNVRLVMDHDPDALSVERIRPKTLVTKGRMSLGNIPPQQEKAVNVTFMPELCISSSITTGATYTDVEGRKVHVPGKPLTLEVSCPYIEPGGEVGEEQLLNMSEDGLGETGRRVFTYGIDVDRDNLFMLALRLVTESGPMKVMEIADDSLMRKEAWFLGSGEGGTPRVMVRISLHGADHLLELFLTSDDGATATGLLTYLAGEFLDTASSEMPGKRVERVREASTLEDIAAWPSLLDYKIMGE